MPQAEKIFVVVNPFDDKHIALERAVLTAKLRQRKPLLHVFVVVDPTDKRDKKFTNGNVSSVLEWFDEDIHNPIFSKSKINYGIEISWSSKWQQAIIASAGTFGDADTIFLTASQNTSYDRFSMGKSKWSLLKNSDMPVMLVRTGSRVFRKTVLAAINIQAEADIQQQLNQRIIERSQRVAARYNADLHVVNAYRDSLKIPEMDAIQRATGLASSQIHIQFGYTDEVVADVSQQLEADLVVVGTLGINGRKQAPRGNTAEMVISALEVDTLIFN